MCGFLALMTVAGIAGASAANAMTMTSLGIKPGGKIAAEQVSNGCDPLARTCRRRSPGPARPRERRGKQGARISPLE